MNSVGIFSVARDDLDISSCEKTCDPLPSVNVEYPEFLGNLVAGSVTLVSWLGSVEDTVVHLYKPRNVQHGKIYCWEDISIYGLTLWKVLTSLPTICSTNAIFSCWKRLVGSPVLAFLHQQGLQTDETWLLDGPPCLPNFGKSPCWESKHSVACC